MSFVSDQDVIAHRMFRILMLTVSLVMTTWAVVDVAMAHYLPALLAGGGVLILSPLSLWIHRRGRADAATHVFIASGMFYIAIGHLLLSRTAGFEYYLFPSLVLAIAMFRGADYRNIFFAVGTIAVGTAVIHVIPEHVVAPLRPVAYPDAIVGMCNFVVSYVLSVIFVVWHVHAMRTLNAKQIERAGVKNDDLRRAFDRIARDERRLNDVFQGMLEGVRTENLAGEVTRQNQAAFDLLGVPGAASPPRIYDVASGVELKAADWPSRVTARTGRAIVNMNLRIVRADQSVRFVTVNSLPVAGDADEGFSEILITLLDVTERRKSEHLMRQTFDSTPDWIFIKDVNHRYVMVNEAYAAALGRTVADVVGRNDLELGFPEAYVKGDPVQNIRGFWADDNLVIQTGCVQTFDNDPAVVKGVSRIFHTVKAPLFEMDDAQPYAVLGVSRDITELRQVEQKLLSSSKMASLGQMAGGIAHEINNPLAIIHGKTSVLLRLLEVGATDPDRVREGVLKIQETVERIGKIIKGLKTFSRGGEDDPFERIPVRQLVQDAVSLCADRFRAIDLKIEVPVLPDIVLNGSAVQLSQILINFLNNAHDAVETLPERWIRIEILALPNQTVSIAVVDSGRGIPAEVAAKLAQPFFTTKPVGRGTGLGLTISRQIIERHGGILYLDQSSPNTRFVINLPIAPATAGDRAA